MYEPKYKLNKKDDARWHALVVRECCELPVKPGGKVKFNPKFPPLKPEERLELERLQRKRGRKQAKRVMANAIRRAKRAERQGPVPLKKGWVKPPGWDLY